ncbi:MAG: Ig-like domain-containing protein [Methanobrevibacter sp.]|nr:Ig-like domain-containing protein [Methanobrevibacter sp.]
MACIKAFTVIDVINTVTSLAIDYVDFNPVNITAYVLNQFGIPVDCGEVIFNLSGNIVPVNVSDGVANIIYNFTSCSNEIFAEFNAIGYGQSSFNQSINLNPKGTIIYLTDITTIYNGYEYKIKLTDDNGNPLSGKNLVYTLNNVTDTLVTDENGEALLNINLNDGVYVIEIRYDGEEIYLNSSNSSIINVKSSINLPSSNYTYGSKYIVSLLDKDSNPLANQTVSIVFAGKTYNLKTDSNGKASINITLKPGTYKVTIKNPDTLEEKNQTIKVLKRITENKNLVMYYGAGSSYKVRVYDDYGRIAKNVTVKFKINGKTYSRKTNNNGYAYLKISLKPKKYAISATYKGFTVKNNVTVKSTVITKNITKKKAKTIKFTAKLVNYKGKILKYKYIKFKFKSKIYKRKTNAKGIATLSLKNLKRGKHVIYSTYGKLTIKNTIRIK